jgi:hypothetical protein
MTIESPHVDRIDSNDQDDVSKNDSLMMNDDVDEQTTQLPNMTSFRELAFESPSSLMLQSNSSCRNSIDNGDGRKQSTTDDDDSLRCNDESMSMMGKFIHLKGEQEHEQGETCQLIEQTCLIMIIDENADDEQRAPAINKSIFPMFIGLGEDDNTAAMCQSLPSTTTTFGSDSVRGRALLSRRFSITSSLTSLTSIDMMMMPTTHDDEDDGKEAMVVTDTIITYLQYH